MDQTVDRTRRRVSMVELYWQFGRSCNRVRNALRSMFGRRALPTNKTILETVNKFHDTGTIQNLQKGHSGRPRTVQTEENTTTVEEFFEENPHCSTRRASAELALSRTSVRRILKKVKMHPYKVQVFQQLTQYDMERRLAFAQKMLRWLDRGKVNSDQIWFSDEAHFWLSGYVNKQNYRFWAKENPRVFQTTTMKPVRVTVFCALCSDGIIGPIFFDENVTGEAYRKALRRKFIPVAGGMDAIGDYWFMQDGALPHRTNAVFELLDEHFHGRVIGLGYESKYGSGIDWPPYSPDLNPCDFFLWGYLKDKVYRQSPRTKEELIERIEEAVNGVTPATLRSVIANFRGRLEAVVAADGAHIEQYLH